MSGVADALHLHGDGSVVDAVLLDKVNIAAAIDLECAADLHHRRSRQGLSSVDHQHTAGIFSDAVTEHSQTADLRHLHARFRF